MSAMFTAGGKTEALRRLIAAITAGEQQKIDVGKEEEALARAMAQQEWERGHAEAELRQRGEISDADLAMRELIARMAYTEGETPAQKADRESREQIAAAGQTSATGRTVLGELGATGRTIMGQVGSGIREWLGREAEPEPDVYGPLAGVAQRLWPDLDVTPETPLPAGAAGVISSGIGERSARTTANIRASTSGTGAKPGRLTKGQAQRQLERYTALHRVAKEDTPYMVPVGVSPETGETMYYRVPGMTVKAGKRAIDLYSNEQKAMALAGARAAAEDATFHGIVVPPEVAGMLFGGTPVAGAERGSWGSNFSKLPRDFQAWAQKKRRERKSDEWIREQLIMAGVEW